MHENSNVKRTRDGTNVVSISVKTKIKQYGTSICHKQDTKQRLFARHTVMCVDPLPS